MSGDVQPRKRKDKRKKKDDLGVEEPRGTAAVFGEGDVFMHSQHEHGTGGHWCAKIIFFSLLAVLVGLIGLIILENRGLSDLEANAVQSQYSGVLEGWLEDIPDDDHHDEHTLDLNHHDDDDDEELHGSVIGHDEHDEDDHEHSLEENEHDDELEDSQEPEHDDDDENESQQDDDQLDDEDDDQQDDEDDEQQDDDDDQQQDDDDDDQHPVDESNQDDEDESRQVDEDESNQVVEQDVDDVGNQDEDDDDEHSVEATKDEDNDEEEYKNTDTAEYEEDHDEQSDEEQGDDDLHDVDDNDNLDDDDDENDSNNNDDENQNDDENSHEDNDEDDEEHEEPEQDSDVEVEHIEKEVTDDVVLSEEKTAKDDEDSQEISREADPVDDPADEGDDVEFLESDELDELPEVLPIPVPSGKPLAEFEETSSTERPHDTLADEEEYERQQEELRKEKEQASQGLWLKLTVGGALLVATHAVLRRAAAPQQAEESDRSREETPLTDRRMTLIPETTAPPPPPPVTPKIVQEVPRPIIEKEVHKTIPVAAQPPPMPEEEFEEEEVEEEEEQIVVPEVQSPQQTKNIVDMELYSDEEELEEEEVEEKINVPEQIDPVLKEVTPEPEEDDDDVEIIDEEQLEEELEEEDDISDVDDAELLSRLEAKYGRLPEPERPGRKDGGNSIEADWPGEPNDPYWQDQLDQAQRELREGEWSAAEKRASHTKLAGSARARYIVARALDSAAEAKRDNALLTKAIAAYLELLKMNERLSDKKLLEVADRTLDRIKFRGNYLGAEPVYRLLIRRFPNEPQYRNNLTISFLMANRADLAENVLVETLKLWPNDKVALAHFGFVLKTNHNKLEEAVEAFTKALEGDSGPACEPRFYYHLGDALLLLGRPAAARRVHARAAARGHFLSAAQRSLYNVDRLKSRPWWKIEDTPYLKLAQDLERSWREILKEGEAAEKQYEQEKEGLKDKGEWTQWDLFVRGREVAGRCARAPVSCGVVRAHAAARSCRRGQVKFSAMRPHTHVRAHVGPTNCRLRMHLGLKNTRGTYIRVDQEIRQWEVGKVFMFDDSFEHEVWHNGTGTRLVLIVDVWHPDLTPAERAQLPAI